MFSKIYTTQDEYIGLIDTEVIKTMNSVCEYCNLSTEHLTESSAVAVSSGIVYYTSELVYSSSSGNTTASSVITLTQNWLTQQHNNIVVHINNTELVLSKLCLLNDNQNTRATCQRIMRTLANTSSHTPVATPVQCTAVPPQVDMITSTPVVAGAALGGLVCGIIITDSLATFIMWEHSTHAMA